MNNLAQRFNYLIGRISAAQTADEQTALTKEAKALQGSINATIATMEADLDRLTGIRGTMGWYQVEKEKV